MPLLAAVLPRRAQTTTTSLFQAALSEAETQTSSSLRPNTNTNTAKTLVRVKSAAFRQSPKKTNLVAKVCRRLTLAAALDQMRFSPKRAAAKVGAALRQAARLVGEQAGEGDSALSQWVVAECFVGKAAYLKRMKLHARGRFGVMHRPACHVTVVVARTPVRDPQLQIEKDFAKLVRIFTRHRLYAPFVEPKKCPRRFLNPVWSAKSWKYVTSKKWLYPKQ
ncbi:ribosomal protein L22/L17 [Obelidium mucronatum]|nr:ribosomal protein L22/L17 [Obelidium mucronatum]